MKTDRRYKSRRRAQGIKIPEIAKIIDVSQRTLYRWFDRFDNDNLKSIHKLWSRGRKSLLSIQEHAQSIKIHIKKA